MRRTENPVKVIRFHLFPQFSIVRETRAHWIRYSEFRIPLIGVTGGSLVAENICANNYFVVANASMTDENLYGVVQFPQVR